MFTLCVHLYILIRGQGCTYILQYLYVYFAICCISDSFSVSFTISLIILVYFISLPLYKYILYLMLLHGLDDILCISVQPHLNSDLFFFLFFFLFLFFFFFFVLFSSSLGQVPILSFYSTRLSRHVLGSLFVLCSVCASLKW